MAKKKDVKVNLKGFFEQGFEAKDWVNIRNTNYPYF